MILIQRRKNESVVIGDAIILTVLEVRGDQVRIGVEYPRNVTVHRQENDEAIRRQRPEEDAVTPSASTTRW